MITSFGRRTCHLIGWGGVPQAAECRLAHGQSPINYRTICQHATYTMSVVGPFAGVENQEASFDDGLLADFGDPS